MPCRTDWPDDEFYISKENYREIKKEGDLITRLLCATIRGTIRRAKEQGIAAKDFPEYQNLMAIPDMRRWWIQHKKEDRARRLKAIEDKKNAVVDANLKLQKALKDAEKANQALKAAAKKIRSK